MRTHYIGSKNLHIERMSEKKGRQFDDIFLSQVKQAYSRRVAVCNFLNVLAVLTDRSERWRNKR